MFEKMTPKQWCNKWSLTILDADGWKDVEDLKRSITEEDFFNRASRSTCSGNMLAFNTFFNSLEMRKEVAKCADELEALSTDDWDQGCSVPIVKRLRRISETV